MDAVAVLTIIVSVLSSSLVTLLVSSYFIEPAKDKRTYMFDEKKRVYNSMLTFAQIFLYPDDAKYSLGVARYDIQKLTNEEMKTNVLRDMKMAIPKIRLITSDNKVIEFSKKFIDSPSEEALESMIHVYRRDLYK